MTERISVVGGGCTGLGISHTLDPNDYLLSGGEELTLVDAGAGLGRDRILGEEGVALFAGDTVFAGGRISLIVAPGSDLPALQESVATLRSLDVASLLPGHGIFPLEGGQEHIDQATETFSTMLPPRSILQ